MKKTILQKGLAMPVIIAIVVVIIVLIGIGYFVFQNSSQSPQNQGIQTLEDGTMVKPDGTMTKPDGTIIKPDGTMVKPDGTMVPPNPIKTPTTNYAGKVLAGSSSPLLDFVKSDYDSALTTDKLVVLYFYANWCPICKAEIPNLYGVFNDLADNNVIGFRINYNDNETDSDETALARQYGITYQHTKVFLKNGQQVLKGPDSWTKDRYVSEINRALSL